MEWTEFQGIEPSEGESIPFNEVPGPSRQAKQLDGVSDHFKLFMPDAFVQGWVTETNRYAMECEQKKPSKTKWLEVCFEELLAFLGMVIAMGLVNLSSIPDFFSLEPILSHPWFPSIMSRNRFQQINKYFHISNSALYPNDKLAKVRPFVEHLVDKFRTHWTPHQHISIDEQMIGTRCRVSFIQYMPKKPMKFGVKNWVLADSVMPFVCNFQIYTGKEEGTAEQGLASRVVFDLMEPYLYKGHRLFTDNFYSSPTLFKDLYEKGTLACGTVRQDRKGMPKQLMTKNSKGYEKGESKFLMHECLTVVRWKDKRDVFALSTFHGNSTNEEMPHKPDVISCYNKFMNGVDRSDQLLSYYSLNRKSVKWWEKVHWRLFELVIINMYQIMKFKIPSTNVGAAPDRQAYSHISTASSWKTFYWEL